MTGKDRPIGGRGLDRGYEITRTTKSIPIYLPVTTEDELLKINANNPGCI